MPVEKVLHGGGSGGMRETSVKMGRKIIFAAATGGWISFCYIAGKQLDLYDSLDMKDAGFYLKWLLGTFLFTGICYFLWDILDKNEKRITGNWLAAKAAFRLPHWLCVLILLLCWLPAWLSIFPGAFSYDAYAELDQVRNGMLTTHHPVAHVLLLGGLTEGLHSLTGSYNVGIAVYTFLQMFILSNVLAYSLSFLREFHVPDIFRWFALLFYGFSPVMQLFSISATKDVLFSAFQLMFLMDLIRIGCRREEFFEEPKNPASFGITAFCTMILRNNGFYIVLFTLAILAVVCRKKWKKLLPVLLGIGILYGAYVGPLYSVLHVTPGGVEEKLSVPLQQMARVHRYEHDSLAPQDLDLLYQIVPKEDLDSYRATVSDFVKKGFIQEGYEKHKKEFYMLWCRWGMKYPLTYLNSFLINTVDFWYPNAVVDGYRFSYGKGSYFDYQVSEPGKETILLTGAHEYYKAISLDLQVQRFPFMFLVLSPGWYLMVAVMVFMYLWRCRRYGFLLAGVMFLLSFLTVLLGPMALVRYVLIFYYSFPVLLSVALCSGNFTIKTDFSEKLRTERETGCL